MSFEEIIAESASLTPEQRRHLIGHLLAPGRTEHEDARRTHASDESLGAVCHRVNELTALEADIADRAGL
ncbi:MAG: hypothetical protein ABMA01_09590 [Chthoniobacteraceae bacterium]